MSISYWLDQSAGIRQNYDAVIIGAGIAGLSTAYWLEKSRPGIKIAIVERAYPGSGASGRNAGFVTCGSAEHFAKLEKQFGLAKAVEIWKFSEENRELLKNEIIRGQDQAAEYFATGSCTVAPSPGDWERYAGIHQTMRKAGIDVELIDEAYLSAHYGVNGFQGAIQYKHDGLIHPVKLLQMMRGRLTRTDFILDEEVFEVSETENSVTLKTRKQILSAGQLFVGLNGYTSLLFPEFKNLILPQRGQVAVTEPLPPFVKGPCYLTKHLCYFRQLPTGELLVGGFRNHDLEAENTAFDEVTAKIQAALTDFIQSYFKNTKTARIQHRWSGVMGFTEDGQMLIGRKPGSRHIYMMAGCSGHGMGLSFNAARTLVRSSEGTEPPSHLNIARLKI